ncbi:MAG: hypothetical protein JNL41_18285 [Phenylobacterium sp.]|uniref:hypothetical protein n=1 Tax=Phenylobacterium sp. TaxID=1871053 RepID=UPI001A3C42C2|nr:hypothetical protein [Phenylobacterium sp.]MBL8556231.1 hypothetical protein [Phenylobacterium sp.]
MSEALPDIGDIEAVFGLVLRVDLALLQHVNAQALETTDPGTLNDYVRSQTRLTRSVRTTLTTPGEAVARGGRGASPRAPPRP